MEKEYINIFDGHIEFLDIEKQYDDYKISNLDEEKSKWLEYHLVENKILVSSVNDYRILEMDTLGFRKKKIMPLLQHFKPVNDTFAQRIVTCYSVCPYCLREFDINTVESNTMIIDIKDDFNRLKTFQDDVYLVVNCCDHSFRVRFPKIRSTVNKADFIRERLIDKTKTYVLFDEDKLIEFNSLITLLTDKAFYTATEIDDYKLRKHILTNRLYIGGNNETN